MDLQEFEGLIGQITEQLQGQTVDASLTEFLDEAVGVDSALFATIPEACHAGIRDGWLCWQYHGGIDYGRTIKQGRSSRAFPSMWCA